MKVSNAGLTEKKEASVLRTVKTNCNSILTIILVLKELAQQPMAQQSCKGSAAVLVQSHGLRNGSHCIELREQISPLQMNISKSKIVETII